MSFFAVSDVALRDPLIHALVDCKCNLLLLVVLHIDTTNYILIGLYDSFPVSTVQARVHDGCSIPLPHLSQDCVNFSPSVHVQIMQPNGILIVLNSFLISVIIVF